MKLVENYERILARAWSVWLAILAAALAALDAFGQDLVAALPGIEQAFGVNWPSKAAAVIAVLIPIARIIRQSNVNEDSKP